MTKIILSFHIAAYHISETAGSKVINEIDRSIKFNAEKAEVNAHIGIHVGVHMRGCECACVSAHAQVLLWVWTGIHAQVSKCRGMGAQLHLIVHWDNWFDNQKHDRRLTLTFIKIEYFSKTPR